MQVVDFSEFSEASQEWKALGLRVSALRQNVEWSREIECRWQEVFLSKGAITIFDPKTGREELLNRPIVTSWNTLFIDRGNDSSLALVISHLGVGFRPYGLYYREEDIYINWGNRQYGASDLDFDIYNRIFLKRKDLGLYPERTGRFSVLLGEENFAHLLHNEISGLSRIGLNANIMEKIERLYVFNEPLGPLESIFPMLASFEKCRIGKRNLEEILLNQNLIHAGDVRLSMVDRDHVIRHVIERQLKKDPDLFTDWSRGEFPCLLLGIRSHSRIVDGVEDAYIELIRIMIKEFGGLSLILDGFSLPVDYNYDLNYPDYMRKAVADSKRKCDAFAKRAEALGVTKTVCTANYDVATAIWLAGRADYYFTNVGTQQHKAGWFSNASGVIHGSPSSLKDEQMYWFNYLVEGSRPCSKLPEHLYKVVDGSRSDGIENYTFSDPEAVARWVYKTVTRTT